MWGSIEKGMPRDVAESIVRRALGRRAEGGAGGSIETGDMAVGRSHAAIYAGAGDFGVRVRASLSFAVGGFS